MVKHIVCAFALALSFVAAGCGGNGCLSALPANASACGANVFIDATASDPVCLSSTSGQPICRGDVDAVCYRCNGAAFTDGCVIKNAQQAFECVHSCDKC